MKKILFAALLTIGAPMLCHAQVNPIIYGSGAPSNPCFNGGQYYLDTTGHVWYSCLSNGSNWSNVGSTLPSNTGGAPSGPAGGALSGTYPNPTTGQPIAPNQSWFYGSPNCGTQTNCYNVSQSATDNAANFAALFGAANSYTASVPGPIRPLTTVPSIIQGNGSTLTFTSNVLIPGGSSAYLIFFDSLNKAVTVTTDNCASSCGYSKIGPSISNTAILQLYGTNPGAATQASTLTATVNANEIIGGTEVVLPGVSATVTSSGNTGSSIAPSVSQTTTGANSMVLSACAWYNASTFASLTSTSGTLIANQAQTSASNEGLAVWATFAPTSGTSVTSGGTLGTSTTWACESVELQGGGTTALAPVVHLPQGYYYYSSGISLANPAGMTLKCDPGTWLDYTGTAHAVDMGVQNLTADSQSQRFRYVIDGCTFTDAAVATQGIYVWPYNTMISLRQNTLMDFGPPSSGSGYMIYGTGENWDFEVGPQNQIYVNDYTPRRVMITNASHLSANAFTRVHDNVIACWPGSQNNGCSVSQTAPGFILDGDENRFYHNNIAFFLPNVEFLCNGAGAPTAGCIGNQMDQNQVEKPVSGATTLPSLMFGGSQNGMLYTQNVTIDINASDTGSVVGPVGGTDKLLGARVNFNTNFGLPAASPMVQLNNLTGQAGNYSYSNECATSANNSALPCPLIHTTGGNITQWNTDNYPSCTLSSGTCAYSFSLTYGVAPRCTGTWNGTGTLTGILKIVTTATTATATSSVGTDTGVIQMTCSAGDSQ